MNSPSPVRERFTTLDWIGVVIAAINALGLVLFPIAGRAFAGMYEDFGPSGQLSVLTRLATSVWFPPALALAVVAAIVVALRSARPLAVRRAWIVGAFGLGLVSVGVCVVGTYLPLWTVGGAVR